MKNKNHLAEIEDKGQTFTETYNTAEEFLMTQNYHLMTRLQQLHPIRQLPAQS